jgi:SAM-dependent methyltransferase
MSLIEIGCAPGGWMAYFNKNFGYSVSGIEYVEEGAIATQHNMEIQAIQANILNLDFFETHISSCSYDVVFSAGFIEHFEDLDAVVKKVSIVAKQYVVTIIPNLYGMNGAISRIIRPTVFYGHKRITKKMLRCPHEEAGLDTLFCNYTCGLQFIRPAGYNAFFDKHRVFANTINVPFGIFNLISKTFSKCVNVYPRTRILSNTLMYIGKKP